MKKNFKLNNNFYPLISIIIPTRNSERTIEKCLRSIREQTYKNIELIVVDNNSIDKTKKIAEKYADKVYNCGPERSAQRNFGASKAHGDYLLIHDSDIYFDKNSVKECVLIRQITDCDAIILPEKSIGSGYWAKVKWFERDFYVENDDIEGPRFFTKEIFNKAGKYNENLNGPEDWALTNEIKYLNAKIERAKLLVLHDEGEVNFFGSSKKKKYYAKDMFGKYAKMYPNEFKRQMSFFIRFTPKKVILKSITHPILMISMIVMKGLEYYNSKN